MGQYFVVINMTKRKQMNCLSSLGGSTVSFDRFTSGCKLAEQLHNLGVKPFLMLSLVGTGFSESALPIGTWAGDRVVIIGDYSDDPDFLTEDEKKELTEKSTTLYSLAGMDLFSQILTGWLSSFYKSAWLLSLTNQQGLLFDLKFQNVRVRRN